MTNLKNLTFLRFFAIGFLLLICLSCEKDEKEFYPELIFPLDTYYVSQGTDLRVNIQQGNGIYDIIAADTSILDFETEEQSWPAGAITITGLKKGRTTLSISDIRNNKSVELTVHVVDPYLMLNIGSPIPLYKWVEGFNPEPEDVLEVRSEIEKHQIIEPQSILILKSGANSEYMLFKDIDHLERAQVTSDGSFEFSLSETPELTLTDKKTGKQEKLSLFFYTDDPPHLLARFLNLPGKIDKKLMASTRLVKLSTSPSESVDDRFLYYQDVSEQIKTKHTKVQTAQLYQDATIMKNFQDYGIKIGMNILVP